MLKKSHSKSESKSKGKSRSKSRSKSGRSGLWICRPGCVLLCPSCSRGYLISEPESTAPFAWMGHLLVNRPGPQGRSTLSKVMGPKRD